MSENYSYVVHKSHYMKSEVVGMRQIRKFSSIKVKIGLHLTQISVQKCHNVPLTRSRDLVTTRVRTDRHQPQVPRDDPLGLQGQVSHRLEAHQVGQVVGVSGVIFKFPPF